jgi:hypothetical protein
MLISVFRHHSESHPALHPFDSAIAASRQAVPTLQHADAALATCAPALRFLEPAAVFLLSPFGTSYCDSAPLPTCSCAPNNTRVRRRQMRHPTQHALVGLDRS